MAEQKIAIFAFDGEPACFAHALLNGMDMQQRGWQVRLIIEGRATALVRDLNDMEKPFAPVYAKAKGAGLIDCVCRACAYKMGALAAAEEQGLRICEEMNGHPSMARYREEGYEIITI